MNIRKALVICHAAILACLLFIFTVGLYVALSYHLYAEVDSSLNAWTAHIMESLEGVNLLEENRLRLNSNHLFSRLSLMESFVLLFDSEYTLINDSTILSEHSLAKLQQILTARNPAGEGSYATVDLDTQSFRIYFKNIPSENEKPTFIVMTGRALTHVEKTLQELVLILLIAWIIAVSICALLSWVFVGRTLHPVKKMTNDALKIAASGKLGRRLNEIGENDEFGELSKALNSMLGSLETSYMTMKKFLADVSHELRTPLTSICLNLEFIQRLIKTSTQEPIAALDDTVADIKRMAGLVNDLLMLARAEAPASFIFEKINLTRMITEITKSYELRLTELKHKIHTLVSGTIMINADREKLRQAIVILIDNAIKYSPADSVVHMQLEQLDTAVQLKLRDAGVGIPENEIASLGQRFYRATNVRAGYTGSGLGLSIVKSILENHNGRIQFNNLRPQGLEVVITLPLSR